MNKKRNIKGVSLIRVDKIAMYESEFVFMGLSLKEMAAIHNVSPDTLMQYQGKFKWRLKRAEFLQQNPDEQEKTQERHLSSKSKYRIVLWRELQQKILDRLRNLESDDEKFEYKIAILSQTLDRSIKGERLEDNQPITIERKTIDTSNQAPTNKFVNITLNEHKPNREAITSLPVENTRYLDGGGLAEREDDDWSSSNDQEN